jgi:hypothetical protein
MHALRRCMSVSLEVPGGITWHLCRNVPRRTPTTVGERWVMRQGIPARPRLSMATCRKNLGLAASSWTADAVGYFEWPIRMIAPFALADVNRP